MAWVVCPRCHFSQMPAGSCRRCGQALAPSDASGAPALPTGGSGEAMPATARRSRWLALAAGAAAIAAVLLLARRGRDAAPPPPPPATPPSTGSIDLSGKWHGSLSKTLAGSPPRPVLEEISIESDRDGAIRAARLVFTDPGRGGAAAGYQTAADGPRRLSEAVAALALSPGGATLSIDFLDPPGWLPDRTRLWKAVEGSGAGTEASRYLLVESLETDYLIQAGINESGFLSYVFFSPAYAPPRGVDELSRVIHPEPGASLRGFRDLLWDLSGAADFVKLELPVAVSGPAGGAPDRIVLKR